MIDDMTALKQAMGEMDAEDPAVAEAAKDRAARILGDARLSFSKMAELIEQRRLLLRPRIVANIKRMDQPDMLGDAAFRDAGSALRREGQTFRQIAEAIELNGGPPSRYVDPVQTSEALQTNLSLSEPAEPVWLYALALAARIIFFPVRHPLRFFTVGLLAFVLFNTVRGFVGFGAASFPGFVDVVAGARQRVDKAMSAVVDKRNSQQPPPVNGGCGIADTGSRPHRSAPPPRRLLLPPPLPRRLLPRLKRLLLPQLRRPPRQLRRLQRHLSTRRDLPLQDRRRTIVLQRRSHAISADLMSKRLTPENPGQPGHVSVAPAVATGAVVDTDLLSRHLPIARSPLDTSAPEFGRYRRGSIIWVAALAATASGQRPGPCRAVGDQLWTTQAAVRTSRSPASFV